MKSPCAEKRCGPCPVGYIFEEYGEERGQVVANAVEEGVGKIPPEARNYIPLVHDTVQQSAGMEKNGTFQRDVEIQFAVDGVVIALQGSCDQRPQFSDTAVR